MDKQEFMKYLEEEYECQVKLWNCDSSDRLQIGKVNLLKEIIDKAKGLDEPENQEIPAELAKKIENFKGKVTDDYIIYSIFLDDEYDNLKKDTHQWIKDNPGKLSRAVVNGYTIEKEPAWVVKAGGSYVTSIDYDFYDWTIGTTINKDDESILTFTDKKKAEAVATLVDGTVEEWSE